MADIVDATQFLLRNQGVSGYEPLRRSGVAPRLRRRTEPRRPSQRLEDLRTLRELPACAADVTGEDAGLLDRRRAARRPSGGAPRARMRGLGAHDAT